MTKKNALKALAVTPVAYGAIGVSQVARPFKHVRNTYSGVKSVFDAQDNLKAVDAIMEDKPVKPSRAERRQQKNVESYLNAYVSNEN